MLSRGWLPGPADVITPTGGPHPVAAQGSGGWLLPDVVGLLVAGQYRVCNGLLQVLPLSPQDLLEVVL